MGQCIFLAELRARVSALNAEKGRPHYLGAESDLNDVKIILPEDKGGYGLDAQWCDDFHHSVHTLLTGDRYGYYEDFGNIRDMEKTFREGFVYTWDYSSFRKRMHGNSAKGMSPDKFVVCSQNHDQVGNRMNGERLTSLTNYEGLKLAASGVILSRYLPLLFMGEEYGEDSPFLYFMSFSDEGLLRP
jgi:maltooligosyltrehalose trehalohydrolase